MSTNEHETPRVFSRRSTFSLNDLAAHEGCLCLQILYFVNPDRSDVFVPDDEASQFPFSSFSSETRFFSIGVSAGSRPHGCRPCKACGRYREGKGTEWRSLLWFAVPQDRDVPHLMILFLFHQVFPSDNPVLCLPGMRRVRLCLNIYFHVPNCLRVFF